METVGVLALQGSFAEHLEALKKLPNLRSMPVKKAVDLAAVDRLIIPGGESTAMARLLTRNGLDKQLRQRILAGMPVWGTCAGLILLAKELDGEVPHLAVMDMRVRRNAYGSQLDSFESNEAIPAIGKGMIDMVFIRAPQIMAVTGDAKILAAHNGHIVAVRQQHMLATAFHPELTDNPAVYNYFRTM